MSAPQKNKSSTLQRGIKPRRKDLLLAIHPRSRAAGYSGKVLDKYLLAFLGNPGKKYTATRHNAGFMLAEYFHTLYQDALTPWEELKKYSASISEGALPPPLNPPQAGGETNLPPLDKGGIGGVPVILAKPTTFMNNSGIAVQKLTHNAQRTISSSSPTTLISPLAS